MRKKKEDMGGWERNIEIKKKKKKRIDMGEREEINEKKKNIQSNS